MSDLTSQLKISADASGVEAGVAKARKSLTNLGDHAENTGKRMAGSTDRASRAIDNQVSKLQQAALAVGQTTTQTRLMELANRGATAAQLRSAESALRTVDAYRAQQEALTRTQAAVGALASRAGIAGAVIIAAMGGAVASTAQLAAELDDLSQSTGITVEALQELRFAANVGGTGFETLTAGLKKLQINMASAAAGEAELSEESEGAAAAFNAMGLSLADLQKPTREVLLTLAEKFSGYSAGAKSAALATAIFGKSGQDLLPFLNQGRAGIEALSDEARKLGLVIGGDVNTAAAEFDDSLQKLKAIATAAGQAIGNDLIPKLSQFVQELIEGRKAFGGFFNALVQIGVKSNPFQSYAEGAKTSRDEIARLQKQMETLEKNSPGVSENAGGAAFVGQRSGINRQKQLGELRQRVAEEQARLAYLEGLQRRVLDAAGEKTERDFFGRGPSKQEAPAIKPPSGAGGGSKSPKVDEAERYLQSLRDQLRGVTDLTAFEKALGDVQGDRLKGVTQLQRDQILAVATDIDQTKAAVIASNERAAARKAENASIEEFIRLQEEANRTRLQSLLSAGPDAQLEKQRSDLLFLAEKVETGKISPEQFSDAATGLLGLNKQLSETKGIADDLGLSFSSAFEDAIVGGGKLSDVLKGLEKDILRIVTRKLVTEPLGNSITGLLKGATSGSGDGFLSSIFSSITGLFGGGRADGGPVEAGKFYRVNERGPELLTVGKAQFLMMGAQGGHVTPSPGPATAPARGPVTVNVMVPSRTERQTRQQVASDTAMALRRAERFA